MPVIICIATVILEDRLQLRLQTVRLRIFDSDGYPIQKHGLTVQGSVLTWQIVCGKPLMMGPHYIAFCRT